MPLATKLLTHLKKCGRIYQNVNEPCADNSLCTDCVLPKSGIKGDSRQEERIKITVWLYECIY